MNENNCKSSGCKSSNKCIACTVTQCAYHCKGENYCSLNMIRVGTHEANPTEPKCTDCQSFRPATQG